MIFCRMNDYRYLALETIIGNKYIANVHQFQWYQ